MSAAPVELAPRRAFNVTPMRPMQRLHFDRGNGTINGELVDGFKVTGIDVHAVGVVVVRTNIEIKYGSDAQLQEAELRDVVREAPPRVVRPHVRVHRELATASVEREAHRARWIIR